jgi:hypothetical protein
MKSSILPFVLGMFFGIVFQHDIPIINSIDFQSIRADITGFLKSYQKQEIQPEEDERKAVKPKKRIPRAKKKQEQP